MVFTSKCPALLEVIRDLTAKAGLLYDRTLDLMRLSIATASPHALVDSLPPAPERAMIAVTHPAEDGAQMRALHHDGIAPGAPAKTRAAELATLCDWRLPALLTEAEVALIGYADLR